MEMNQRIAVETKQILSQTQIQSLEILAMDTVELEAFLQNEYMDNPLLEHTPTNEISSSMENYSKIYENPYTGGNYVNDKEDERDEGRTFVAPKKDYLKEYLTSQLDIQHFSKEEWQLISFCIGCLEDDGLFTLELDELCHLTGRDKNQVEDILGVLQDLEPYGIFAKDLPNCLIKQLEMMEIVNPVLNEIILNHLTDISEGKISTISRKMNLSTAEVRKYIAIISKLNPKPLCGLQETEVNYIVPDIIFEKQNNQWEVKINDNWFGEYGISDYYIRMMQEAKDPELVQYFKKKLERSRFIISSIEQRRETIYNISEIILNRQKDFFEGHGMLKPITMAEIAEEIGVHPSTITRAVKGKYIQSPQGTLLMKNVFSTAVSSSGRGDDVSSNHVKERIRELIDGEDKRNPLSDSKLVEILKKEGIQISRRAIAKYRDEMWIKSSFDRKER